MNQELNFICSGCNVALTIPAESNQIGSKWICPTSGCSMTFEIVAPQVQLAPPPVPTKEPWQIVLEEVGSAFLNAVWEVAKEEGPKLLAKAIFGPKEKPRRRRRCIA